MAVRRGLDRGLGSRERRAQLGCGRADVAREQASVGADVAARKEAAPLHRSGAANVVAVDQDQLHGRDLETAPAEHPELERDVIEVLFPSTRTGLDLAQAEAPAREALEHVDAHSHAPVLEGSLEDRRHPQIREQLLGASERRAEVALDDRHAARKERPGTPMKLPADREPLLALGIACTGATGLMSL